MSGQYARMLEPGRMSRYRLSALAALSVIVVAIAAFSVGRASAPGAPANSPPIATKATGSAQTAGTVPGWPGATRLEHGVPVGYAHTQEGAVQAATNFNQVLASAEFLLHPDTFRAALRTMAAPSWKVDPETRLASLAPQITAAAQGKQVILRSFEISFHVDAYSDSMARVTLLTGLLVAADGVGTPVVGTSGESYAMTWLGDWRIVDEGTAYAPGLQLANPPPQSNQMPDGLKQSTGIYSYAPRP